MKPNKARALRTDLKGTDGRHPNSTATTRALCVGAIVLAWGTVIERGRPTATGSPATTGAEAVRHFRDRDHGRVTTLYGLAIDVADAQATLKKFRDRAKWGWA